ncbi:MAG: DUF418 domain-containing protein [Planctomycetota bacterium]
MNADHGHPGAIDDADDSGWAGVDVPAPPPAPGPTRGDERIEAIDALRGVALLGILLMNIRAFTMVMAAYMNPTVVGPLTGADRVVWWITSVLADQKFMALFSMLFGAGVVLMYEHRDAAGRPTAGLHYRRMAGLLVIGVVHAYGLWYGDVLVIYALCGLWLFLLRRRGPWLLLGLGFGFLLIGSGFNLLFGVTIPLLPAEDQAEILTFLTPDAETLAAEAEAHRGGWWAQMSYRVPAALEMHTFFFLIWGVWRAGGMMLIGMALLKFNVLRGTASRKTYAALIIGGGAVGLFLIVTGMLRYPAEQRGTAEAMFLGSLWNYWGSVPLAVAYAAGVMLACKNGTPRWLRPVAAVGRTALTNYLGQTVICTLIFYGTVHSLGLFGRVGWSVQMLVVAGVWAVQLTAATWWLKRFRMGPMEWVWRWASYGTRPVLRRNSA